MTKPEPGRARSTALQRTSDGRLGRASWLHYMKQDIRAGFLPALILSAGLIGAFILESTTGGPLAWGLSRAALAEGRWQTLGLHAVAHGGVAHLWMNVSALLAFSIPVRHLLGWGASGWARYFVLLTGAAVCSAAAYLLIQPDSSLPMVGASGAICGLWGLLTRCDPATGAPRVLASGAVISGLRGFAVSNLFLFGLLFLATRAVGSSGGLAWEAHLGGFAFGLLLGPLLLAPSEVRTPWLVADDRADQESAGTASGRWRDMAVIALSLAVMFGLNGRQAFFGSLPLIVRHKVEYVDGRFEIAARGAIMASVADQPEARILSLQGDTDPQAESGTACGWIYLSPQAGAAPFYVTIDLVDFGLIDILLPRLDSTAPDEWAQALFDRELVLRLCHNRSPPPPAEVRPNPEVDETVRALFAADHRQWVVMPAPSGEFIAVARQDRSLAIVSSTFTDRNTAEQWVRNHPRRASTRVITVHDR